MLRLCGAELVEVPAVPYSNPNNYVKISGRLAAEIAKIAAWRDLVNQSTMSPTGTATSQPPARKSGTKPTAKSTGTSQAVGTGGTLGGIAIALKERNKAVKIALADPMGAAL